MSITVVATIKPLPEHKDAVRAAVLGILSAVHAEPGCELYALHEADDRFVMVEQWSSREALAVHSSGAALAELGPQLADKLAGAPDVLVLDQLPGGDPVKGRLVA